MKIKKNSYLHNYFKKFLEIKVKKIEIWDKDIKLIINFLEENLINDEIISFEKRNRKCVNISKYIISLFIKDNFNLLNKFNQLIFEILNTEIESVWLIKVDTILLNNYYTDTYHVLVWIKLKNKNYIILDFTWSQFNCEIHDEKQYLPEFLIWINYIPKVYIDYSYFKIIENKNFNFKIINDMNRISKKISLNVLEKF